VRLFVAVHISPGVREALGKLVEGLALSFVPSSNQKVRWVPSENFHVTLKFIGQVPPTALDAIRTSLCEVRALPPFSLRVRGLHFFPNHRRPRVFWAGVDAPPELGALAGAIDEKLEPLQIARERHAYTPHLTLARFNPPGLSEELRTVVGGCYHRDFGMVPVSEFRLMESKLKSSGAEYTTLQTFDFAAEA
jgi:2'-5' RNA ligase